jgi:hypothetical protein
MRGPATVNPLLNQVLYRRRMMRYARLSGACWVVFGGLHIAVWSVAFENHRHGWPQGVLGAAVWPLLLIATAGFIGVVVFTARWLLAPSNTQDYEWLENRTGSPVEATEDENDPTMIGRARLVA